MKTEKNTKASPKLPPAPKPAPEEISNWENDGGNNLNQLQASDKRLNKKIKLKH